MWPPVVAPKSLRPGCSLYRNGYRAKRPAPLLMELLWSHLLQTNIWTRHASSRSCRDAETESGREPDPVLTAGPKRRGGVAHNAPRDPDWQNSAGLPSFFLMTRQPALDGPGMNDRTEALFDVPDQFG